MKDPKHDININELLASADWLKNLATRLVADSHLADDLVQETWLAALRSPPPHRRSLRGWLGSVLRRCAGKHHRAQDSRMRRETASVKVREIDDVATRFSIQRLVVDEIDRLAEPLRETVLLHYFDGLSSQQIAARKDIPAATVRVRLHRAHEKLRLRLDDLHDGDRQLWALPLAGLCTRLGSGLSPNLLSKPLQKSEILGMNSKLIMGAFASLVAVLVITQAPSMLGFGWADEPPELNDSGPINQLKATSPRALKEVRDSLSKSTEASSPSPIETSKRKIRQKTADSRGSGRIEVKATWSDGKPVRETEIQVIRWESANAVLLPERRLVTDDNGTVVFENVGAGKISLTCVPYNGRAELTVLAGGIHSVAMAVDVGISVTGEVVDKNGSPVAKAVIRLANYSDHGRIVARADKNGRFRLQGLTSGVPELVALAPGFGPSRPKSMSRSKKERASGKRDTHKSAQLVLESAAGSLTGMVVGNDGMPIPGAVVEAEAIRNPMVYDERSWVRLRQVTGKDGSFFFSCLASGATHLRVACRGYASHVQRTEIQDGSNVVVILSSGASVVGVVRDQRGKPVTGVEVASGMLWGFKYNRVTTKEDGRFKLVNLPLGSLNLRAYKQGAGKARTTVELDLGSIVTWNPVIDMGLVIRGQVVDSRGNPMTGLQVNAFGPLDRSGKSSSHGQSYCDDQGHFLISNRPAGPLLIAVFDRSKRKFVAVLRDVIAGEGNVLVRLGDPGFATITGVVEGTEAELRHFEIRLAGISHRQLKIDPKTGRFGATDVLPCDWDIRLAGNKSASKLGVYKLHRNQALYMGRIKISR